MTLSQDGVKFIEAQESFSPVAYRDARGHSIGFGYFLATQEDLDKYLHATISREQGQELLMVRARSAEDTINKAVHVALTQTQFDALVSWAYNVGNGAAAGSSLVRLLNVSNFAGAVDQFSAWRFSQHVEVPALVKRRALEAKLFSHGEYS